MAKAKINIDGVTIDNMLAAKRDMAANTAMVDFITSDLGKVVNNVLSQISDETPAVKAYQDSAINRIGDAYSEAHPEQISNMVLGPGAAQYYIFANHSIVTSLIRDIKLDPKVAENLLNRRFNRRGKFLKQFAYDDDVRSKIRVRTFGGITLKNSGDEGRYFPYFGR